MINNILCIICKDIVEDSNTKMLSYLNCVEQVTVKKFPSMIPALTLGTTWFKDSDSVEKLQVRIKTILPNGEEKKILETPEGEMKTIRHRINCVINEISLTQEGVYRFVVEKREQSGWAFAAAASFLVLKKND